MVIREYGNFDLQRRLCFSTISLRRVVSSTDVFHRERGGGLAQDGCTRCGETRRLWSFANCHDGEL